jgi:transposase
MRRRYELSQRYWDEIATLLPHPTHHDGRGHPWNPHRPLLNAILWICHTGAPWRDLPERYGPWQTAYDRFRRWRLDGTWSRLVTHLLDHLEQHGQLGHHLWCVDATIIRASRAAAGAENEPKTVPVLAGSSTTQVQEPADHALGYSRGGYGTKVHLLCEEHGLPLGIYLTPGQRHESKAFEPLLEHDAVGLEESEPPWPEQMAGDKGYSYPEIREWLKEHDIEAVIPTRKDQAPLESFDSETYRERNWIERLVGWLKERRRLATRYEKLGVSFLAFWLVGILEILLRRL